MTKRFPQGWVILLATLAAGGNAGAQSVVGTLRTDLDREVTGAFVVLLDSTGTEVARVLTDADGGYGLAGSPGDGWRVKVLRIGFTPWESPEFGLVEGGTYALNPQLSDQRVVLPTISVEAERRCETNPATRTETAALWEQIELALQGTDWTIERRLYRFQTSMTNRTLDPYGAVLSETTTRTTGYSAWAFESLDAEDIAASGFVRDRQGQPVYYGPDTRVLFSPSFLEQHCFSLVADPEWEDAGPESEGTIGLGEELIGLGFEPVRGRRVPDISGVLWVARGSVELRHMEFTYTNLGRWTPQDRAGGRLDFTRLPNGAWIIRRSEIRGAVPLVGGRTIRLAGYREVRADVNTIRAADGTLVARFYCANWALPGVECVTVHEIRGEDGTSRRSDQN